MLSPTRFVFAILVIVSDIGVQYSHGKQYTIIKERVNYFGAMAFCNKNNQRIATINDKTEEDDLKKAILETDDREEWFWIGLTCLSKKGRFKWTSTGQPLEVKFQSWCENQLDNWNNNEDCVTLYKRQDYKWNDAECARELYFVCERNELELVKQPFSHMEGYID